MKQSIAVILIALLIASLFSCGSKPVILPGDGEIHEITEASGVIQRYFVIESEGFLLNAVYTYVPDGKHHPTVLLIGGSGPLDADGTIGAWKPYEDIALGLAEQGICSLRLDKRTLNGAESFLPTDGIEEEYLTDCRAAIACLREAGISDIFLLGHSLGGQIAAVLAEEMTDIRGVILFNSTSRHLADVACDQYVRLDPAHEAEYRLYADAAKASTDESVRGYYYYGATDHYWVTYNRLDTLESIRNGATPTLIVNSTADLQIFAADLAGWQEIIAEEHVTYRVYEGLSHFGYRADLNDSSVVWQPTEFPSELILTFAEFCGELSK